MSEKLTPDSPGPEDKKTFREKIRDSKLLKSIGEHSPAVIFAAGIAMTGQTRDIKPAAFTGAIYFLNKYTREKIIPEVQEYKEDRVKKRMQESLPEEVKTDISTIGIDGIFEKEESIIEKHNANLDAYIINLGEDSEEDANVIYMITETQQIDDDAYIQDKDANFRIGLISDDSYFDFRNGVLLAQYLLRKKLGKNLPEFSEERLHTYNVDVDRGGENLDGGIAEYLTKDVSKQLIDKETFKQFTNLAGSTVETNQLLISGGAYLLGLYESQKEVDDLKNILDIPHNKE